jgi:hypothetical protein
MRYWMYKCNAEEGGPAGYWGDWLGDVFSQKGPIGWGGHYSTRSQEVVHHLDFDVAPGDVAVAYQTDIRAVVGFCRVEAMKPEGAPGEIELQLQPIAICSPPCPIHDLKHGTPLEHSNAVNGPVMLRELGRHEMEALLSISGAPKRVLAGRLPRGGWAPIPVATAT